MYLKELGFEDDPKVAKNYMDLPENEGEADGMPKNASYKPMYTYPQREGKNMTWNEFYNWVQTNNLGSKIR